MPILMPIFLALIFLSFLPCIIRIIQGFLLDHMSAIANQKFNQCTSTDINLSKTVWKTAMKAPFRTPQEPEDLPHTMHPASRKQLKRQMLHPNS
jgi:hypothetical protein